MHKLLTVLFIGILLFSACEQQPKANESEASQKIDKLYQQFARAYDSLDVDLVANLYAEDSFYLIPNEKRAIMKGRSSIRESFAGFMKGSAHRNQNIDITFRIVERKISDSLAFDVGYYRTRSKPDTVAYFPEGGGVGKFVTIMGLMPNGEWKFLLDGYNPAPYEAFLEADSVGVNPVSGNVTN